MKKLTLRNYLLDKRVELYETVDKLKNMLLDDYFSERDAVELEVAEAQLNIIKDIITICNNRNKY